MTNMDKERMLEEVSLEELSEESPEQEPVSVLWDRLEDEILSTSLAEKGLSPLDWYAHSKGKKAVILDGEKMGGDKCVCMAKDDKRVCFSNFALGVLSPEQAGKCGSIDERVMPKEIVELMEAARECGDEKGITEWSACVAKRAPGAVSEYPE